MKHDTRKIESRRIADFRIAAMQSIGIARPQGEDQEKRDIPILQRKRR